MFIPASVNGTKWHDLNADGFKQGHEFSLASIAITLYDDDGDFIATTTTGANGAWRFVEKPLGTSMSRLHRQQTPQERYSGWT